MTNAEKQDALAAMDKYAERYGPKLIRALIYSTEEQCACVLGALAFGKWGEEGFVRGYEEIGEAFNLPSMETKWGTSPGYDVAWNVNDGYPGYGAPVPADERAESAEDRFIRMRQWVESLPVEEVNDDA